ncbi:aminopeptidase N [Arthrobacter woluwensis]|uniref:aminopeptidase N n=1 Tax=Arthrobacter woluwensis TaxID=156980 RepID=UPI000D12C267|nr:aminopeptidase N [Arthrobacter woluwensis]PSS45345.1 aminopeptidase N [Arthrobacter woluwensis]
MQNQNLKRLEAQDRSAAVKTLSYDVTLDVRDAEDPAVAWFPSESVITFEASPGGSTFLDFIGDSVQAVFLNGKKLPVDEVVEGSRIRLDGLRELNQVTVLARALYSRSGEGLHRYVDPADGKTYLYTQYEPADARRVFANFEQPDLKARYTFHVTAPAHWHVASNGAETARTPLASDARAARWDFAETLPLSTYITAVLAGPYFKAEDSWTGTDADGEPLVVPLALFCRASLAESFDTDTLFAQTKRGLDFFSELFDYPYPWGKYDQAFVPEYNLGAMENPGLVTFTEEYVFASKATQAQYEQRANTLLHEMAHMWFGDLVTMQWWDDLWLKESFADFMGTLGVDRASDFTTSWVNFANQRKAWAYVQDQLPTTHPVVADIPDLEAAKQNFDGITYAKGAAVLKQLVAYVGFDAFVEGARSYFKRHEFGNTTLADLLHELDAASGKELASWSEAWLETSGISTLRLEIQDDDGVITAAGIVQDAVDPVTGATALRPHRLRLGLYEPDAQGRLVRTEVLDLDVDGAETEVEALTGRARPALALLNDDDLSYAKIRLDDVSYETVTGQLDLLDDPMARALAWNAVWSATRDGQRPAEEYLRMAMRFAHTESTIGVLQSVLSNAVFAVNHYVPADGRDALRDELTRTAVARLQDAEPGSDAQLAWARCVMALSLHSGEALHLITGLLGGGRQVDGLVLDTKLRWAALQALAAHGRLDRPALDAELAREDNADARAGHALAVAARPTAEAKAEAWAACGPDTELSNRNFSATIAGFMTGSSRLLAPYVEPYFERLTSVWGSMSIGMASRLVLGFFPDAQDLAPGQAPAEHPVVVQCDQWLAAHEDAPRALRRLILEERDKLVRALKAQAAGSQV